MARLADVIDTTADDSSGAGDGGPGPGRALLLVLGLVAIGYALLRWRRRDTESTIEAVSDSLAEEAGSVLEDAQPIEIGEPGVENAEAEEEAADEEDDSIDAVSTTDRSAEEIAERTESDVQEEPAEPGEMTIDEDVADEVTDEDEDDE